MEIIKTHLLKNDNFNIDKSNIITIGFFDGIHKMHKKILKKTKKIAKKNKGYFSVITFSKKIRNFLKNENGQIFSRKKNYQLIESKFQPDFIFEIQTDLQVIHQSKLTFMMYLKNVLHVEKIVIGSDFKFGYKALGTTEDLIHFFGNENIYLFKRNNRYSSSKLLKNTNKLLE